MIHQITNYVVMNLTANATIHVGASPVMAHAAEEVEQMVSVANALVINAGTLSEPWVRGMNLAGKRANEKGVPIVFDPVGVGATTYRTEAIIKMLNSLDIAILKGNSGEIGQINNEEVLVRGVDSLAGSLNPSDTVRQLAQKRNKTTIVALSGPTDYVSDGDRVVIIKNQCDRLNQLTGMGCTVTTLMACFAGVTTNYLVAAVGGFAVMGVCAQLAATDENVRGAASFQVALFDRFSTLTGSELEKLMDIEIVDN
jgi:hydroxyethylthiazole kinase